LRANIHIGLGYYRLIKKLNLKLRSKELFFTFVIYTNRDKNMLGHASPKTTEIYTKTIEINNKKIVGPLENLKNLNTFNKKNNK